MSDHETGELIWKSSGWGDEIYLTEQTGTYDFDMFSLVEYERQGSDIFFSVAHIPSQILKCKAVAREIVFSSTESIENFRLEQRLFLHGSSIEGRSDDDLGDHRAVH